MSEPFEHVFGLVFRHGGLFYMLPVLKVDELSAIQQDDSAILKPFHFERLHKRLDAFEIVAVGYNMKMIGLMRVVDCVRVLFKFSMDEQCAVQIRYDCRHRTSFPYAFLITTLFPRLPKCYTSTGGVFLCYFFKFSFARTSCF